MGKIACTADSESLTESNERPLYFSRGACTLEPGTLSKQNLVFFFFTVLFHNNPVLHEYHRLDGTLALESSWKLSRRSEQ